ncbi:hypothetical protein BHM03_00013017 [Ensete ventricosum]|nr:hypothetical protein BHM03_00013017 [Ensete ventricosum]
MAIIALERKSSIEAEPRTLTAAELRLARGLKPMPSIRDYCGLFEDCDDEYDDEEEEEEEEDEMRNWVELEQSYHTCLQIDVANASF